MESYYGVLSRAAINSHLVIVGRVNYTEEKTEMEKLVRDLVQKRENSGLE